MGIDALLFLLFNCILILCVLIVCLINKILLKYNKNIFPNKYRYFIIFVLLIIFIVNNEFWIHTHDRKFGYNILNKKLATPYLFMSILPIKNIIHHDNIEIELPYGYKLINRKNVNSFKEYTSYSSISIITTGKSWNNFLNEMSTKFRFIDQLSGDKTYLDENTNKIIGLTTITRGGISYLIISIDND